MEAAMRRTPPADFTAATWNVYHGSPVASLRPVLRQLRSDGVSLLLMQEVSNPDVRAMLHDEDLHVAFAPRQYVVAYDPGVWEREGNVEAVRLGSTRWFSTTGAPQWSEAVRVILRHKPSGLTLDALSYHTPAGVQRGGPAIDSVPRRIAVLRESMATLTRLANEGRADAVLYGGDDNVDERHGSGWDFMLEPATGLRQVTAPEGTHGSRKIDDFRVRGLTALAGRVVENVSDHDIHVRAFRFADHKEPAVTETVTRAEWGARSRGATRSSHPIGKTLGITAHWEGPHMGPFPHSECAGKVRSIERFHRDTRGWADIAYNALVCPHGFVFEGRGPGVKSAANGDTQTNEDWYAVCYLGGERDGFTDEGKQGYLDAFGWLAREGAAGPKRNGHRDHKATACPGDEIYRWVSALPDGAGNPASAPQPAPVVLTRVQRARILLARALRLLDQPPKKR